jgi:hypothetical protein
VATSLEIRTYLGRLSATLWNYGATFPVPTLDAYDSGEIGFELVATLPGANLPKPAVIKITEIWAPIGTRFHRAEYAYDFIEHPLDRRRAFHRHHEGDFLRRFGVAVHEHCEEVIGRPDCDHYLGLPVDADEAIRRFTMIWGQPGPLGCSSFHCADL